MWQKAKLIIKDSPMNGKTLWVLDKPRMFDENAMDDQGHSGHATGMAFISNVEHYRNNIDANYRFRVEWLELLPEFAETVLMISMKEFHAQ